MYIYLYLYLYLYLYVYIHLSIYIYASIHIWRTLDRTSHTAVYTRRALQCRRWHSCTSRPPVNTKRNRSHTLLWALQAAYDAPRSTHVSRYISDGFQYLSSQLTFSDEWYCPKSCGPEDVGSTPGLSHSHRRVLTHTTHDKHQVTQTQMNAHTHKHTNTRTQNDQRRRRNDRVIVEVVRLWTERETKRTLDWRCPERLSNSQQPFHNQAVIMRSPFFSVLFEHFGAAG